MEMNLGYKLKSPQGHWVRPVTIEDRIKGVEIVLRVTDEELTEWQAEIDATIGPAWSQEREEEENG